MPVGPRKPYSAAYMISITDAVSEAAPSAASPTGPSMYVSTSPSMVEVVRPAISGTASVSSGQSSLVKRRRPLGACRAGVSGAAETDGVRLSICMRVLQAY